jgi:hypothetical protein
MNFSTMCQIVNKLGTGGRNSTEWECVADNKKKAIGSIIMDNGRTPAIMARLELLIEEGVL